MSENNQKQESGTPASKMDILAVFASPQVEKIMGSMFFATAADWLRDSSGKELKHLVLGACAFTVTRAYSTKALKWLEENGSNTISIPSHEILAQDLETWVAQQPSTQLFSLLPTPSFQNLEWKEVRSDQDGNQWDRRDRASKDADKDNEGYDGYALVASTRRSFFLF
jgi:hypothetical protein